MSLKFSYIRNDLKKKQITVASKIENVNGINVVKCAWSFRSNKDNFIKKEGRKFAIERLENSDPDYSFQFEVDKIQHKVIMENIVREILCRYSTPKKYLKELHNELSYLKYTPTNYKVLQDIYELSI